ncbi:MAG: type II toxin-antitoxin system HicB family antitoxin [Erysipelotrichaceae bacterium]|nr:type II toxin-antitoxin system HicB family antitoxin [Erysipelotrichaceae bacterium]MBR5049228.1 type II toxin-antitoxin system HicB family antitoxin [Erysipelotrichaceae bacterium]
MKTVQQYMEMPYRMEIIPDADEGGYVVSYPDLPGCLSTGETIEEAIRNGEDAKLAWLSAAAEQGLPINEPQQLQSYSGQFKLRIPKSLHRQLAEQASREGISMNQYCVYLLSRNAGI